VLELLWECDDNRDVGLAFRSAHGLIISDGLCCDQTDMLRERKPPTPTGCAARDLGTRVWAHDCAQLSTARSRLRDAPDIQRLEARPTSTTATEPIDRKKLEWVGEPVKWPSSGRGDSSKVIDQAFGAELALIARTLAHAIKLRDDIRAKRITMKRVVAARETTVEELRDYLVLAKLAPVVRDQVLAMTTVTASELVTEEKLRFNARESNSVEQSGCNPGPHLFPAPANSQLLAQDFRTLASTSAGCITLKHLLASSRTRRGRGRGQIHRRGGGVVRRHVQSSPATCAPRSRGGKKPS
jgi:hypothetical protein